MGTIVFGAIALFPLTAQAASLTQWHYDPTTNRLEVTVDQGITPRYFLMAQPARIVLDLPDTAVGLVQSQATYAGAVRQVRVSQFQPGLTRIVLELSPDVELAPGQVKLEKASHPTEPSRWVLRPLLAQVPPIQPAARVSPPTAVSATAPAASEPSLPPQPSLSLSPRERPAAETSAPFPVERPSSIAEPPLSTPPAPTAETSTQAGKPAPAKVVNAEKILPPPTPIPIGSDDGLKDPNASQGVPSLPPASVTPLPPSSSPSELAIDTRNAIKISVPPPLSGIQPETPSASPTSPTTVQPLPPASVSPPTSSPSAKAPPVVVSPPGMDASALDMPSTARVLPNPASTINVPALGSPKPAPASSVNPPSQAASPQSTTPLPAQVQLPPLAPLSGAPSPSPNFSPRTIQQKGMAPGTIAVPIPSPILPPGSESLPASSIPIPPPGQAPLISVPPLAPSPVQAIPSGQIPVSSLPTSQPSIAPLTPATSVPLPSATNVSSPKGAASPSAVQPSTIAFGQPLPTPGAIALNTFPRGVATYAATPSQSTFPGNGQSGSGQPGDMPTGGLQPASVQQAFFQSPNPSVLLPLGATLNLVYPGNATLKLPSGPPLQEVLLLQTEVRNAAGTVVFPQGTYVLGRFDTSGNGSKFIAQAIAVGARTMPFAAESNLLTNKLSTTSVAIGSGVGALLGGAVSSFSGLGLVGGAAVGAATSFLASPKQVTIEPGQVIQVQVKQDLLIP